MRARERLMTVLEGGKADRIPLTIYGWLIRDFDEGAKLQEQGLIPVDAIGVVKAAYTDVDIKTHVQEVEGYKTFTTQIETPAGTITQQGAYEQQFGSPWVQKHYIKSQDDFPIVRSLYENTIIEDNWDVYAEIDLRVGDKGLVLGTIDPLPIQKLLNDFMGPEMWSETLMLHPDKLEWLLEVMTPSYIRQVEIAAESLADVIWFPDNVTGVMMSPAHFEKYCLPLYEQASEILGQAGKLSFAHYDGDNKSLKNCIARAPLDIIEAFTPPPMGPMTVKEAMQAWPDKVISVNFPGNLFGEPEEVIEEYTRLYVQQSGNEGRFIIGCTEEFDFSQFSRVFSIIARVLNEE